MQDFRPFHFMVSMGPPGPPGSTARSAVERSGGEAPVRARSKGAFTNYVYKIWGVFLPPTSLRLHFLWYKSLQKVDFF